MMDRSLLYVGDPMCSWCWGFAPELDDLADRHAIPVDVVVGGLRPGPNAETLDDRLRGFLDHEWGRIAEVTGQPFDTSALEREGWVYDTEPAARAVVTVRELAPDRTLEAFVRFQRAFYAEGVDVTDMDVYPRLVEGLLDVEEFTARLASDASRRAAWQDFATARRLGATGFPTLFVRIDSTAFLVSRGYRPADDISPLVEQALDRGGGAGRG